MDVSLCPTRLDLALIACTELKLENYYTELVKSIPQVISSPSHHTHVQCTINSFEDF